MTPKGDPKGEAKRRPAGRFATVALLLLAGCAVGPDFERPKPPKAAGFTREPLAPKTVSADVPEGEEQRFVPQMKISHDWWTLFQSPALDALVDRAFKANPSLVAAQAALRQAMELVYAQEGFFYPTVGASFSPSYQKASATLSPPLATPALRYGLYTSSLNVGFTPDVFGGNRRMVESLQAQAEFQRFQMEAAYVTLSTNVVAAAVTEASLRAQVEATREIIQIATKSLDLLKLQFKAGAVTGLDVAAQESALAAVEQSLPPLEKQLEQNRDLLLALTGGLSGDPLKETFELSTLHLPRELPLSLPASLVEQRPDVRSAEAQVHSASALVGVAVAKRLPQFSITAAYGGMATSFGQMFAEAVGGNTFWSVVGSASQTIFDGGTLLHQQRAAEAALEQAEALYRSTVITAFQNVADSLYAIHADANNLKAAVSAERAAKVTLDITLKQQQLGAVNYLALLSAELGYQQSLINRVQAQANRLADSAALFQALGGGWWDRPDEKPPAR